MASQQLRVALPAQHMGLGLVHKNQWDMLLKAPETGLDPHFELFTVRTLTGPVEGEQREVWKIDVQSIEEKEDGTLTVRGHVVEYSYSTQPLPFMRYTISFNPDEEQEQQLVTFFG